MSGFSRVQTRELTNAPCLYGVVNGTAAASKALVLDANKAIGTITTLTATTVNATTLNTTTVNGTTLQQDSVTLSPLKWVDVTVASTDLATAATKTVIASTGVQQYKVRNIRLVGGGTNFSAGGDRLIGLTDGTTTWTTIANADIESVPSATLDWGNAKVPFLTGTSDTASVAASTIGFKYSGGTTDHTTGSIKFSVCLEKVA